MADLIKLNQTESTGKRGGARQGAGRKSEALSGNRERWYKARGISPLTAAEILAFKARELPLWNRILESEDDRVVLQALVFLTSMRDGKPAQAINVTSTNLTLNARDIESARAIVAEIRNSSQLTSQPRLGSPLQVDGTLSIGDVDNGEVVESKEVAGVNQVDTNQVDSVDVISNELGNTMLSEDEGGI